MARKKKLPVPTPQMTPEDRGGLFIRYIDAEMPVLLDNGDPLDFSEAMLRGADLRGLDLSDSLLDKASLEGADLTGTVAMRAHLTGVSFKGANLKGAILREALLSNADFTNADLEDADLGETILFGAIFSGANLKRTQLDGARVEAANFSGAKNLMAIDATGLSVNKATYEKSCWDADTLRTLVSMGAEVIALNEFPADALRAVIVQEDGLTLTFAARLSRMEGFMVHGIIIGVLGPDAEECDVAEFMRVEDATIIRLTASDPSLLLKLASVIDRGAREARPQGVQSVTNLGTVGTQVNVRGDLIVAHDPNIALRLAALESLIGPAGRLNELLSHLERIELRMADGRP